MTRQETVIKITKITRIVGEMKGQLDLDDEIEFEALDPIISAIYPYTYHHIHTAGIQRMKSYKRSRFIQDTFIFSQNITNYLLNLIVIFSIIYTNNPFYTAGFLVTQRNGGRERLLMYGETSTPVYKRLMRPEDGMRPQLLNLHSCHTILIEGVTLLNSPFWVIHPLFCESLIVSGVTVFNRGPNGDGCDPESCKNVLIENCTFDTGDDCIAIKSGRNEDGRKWNFMDLQLP